MEKRKLGANGPVVSALGLGCMAMSEFYGPSDDTRSKQVIFKALEQGITLLDTADTYGNGHNETLIGQVLKEWRKVDKAPVLIASKFGISRKPGTYEREICGRPEYVKTAIEGTLKRLGVDVLDLYYIHRIDVRVPIEETMGALSNLVQEGKIRYIGLSEPSPATLLKAHAVHPITCVQSEFSLFTREMENTILPVLRENGIGFVPYSPLGRGMLTGKLTPKSISESTDLRQHLPRFGKAHFDSNMNPVSQLTPLAQQLNISLATLALAWVLAKGEDIVPIPGTRQIPYLMENIQATTIQLDPRMMEKIESIFHPRAVMGERYTLEGMKGVNG